ncbi:MAG TPA: DUF2314 domain-containing protein [Fimbriimonadaceae bacterium]|nr:DUF2314 domain-containing protein [Fimbriimonadaceae bacterium]
MRPPQLWLLTIGVFVVAMVIAFALGGLARRSGLGRKPQLDPELAVAIETAKRSLPQFIGKLQKPPEGATAFVIKASFQEGGHAEMMWVDHLTYANHFFDGTLADAPFGMTTLHKGDAVHVPERDVVDWEIFYKTAEGVVHEGAETDRVLERKAKHGLRYPPRMPPSRMRFA